MKKIITDKQKIDELLEKGVEKIYPSKDEFRKRLLKGERIRLYCGYDPTASSLHIGNAITINKLAQFQALGHEVIFLVGSFTATIGDPTDKASARKKMTREEVDENSKLYKEQASAYLDFGGDNPAQVMNNSTWNDKLSFKDLIELSAHFTVQQMIQRDMFQKRLQEEKPIYLHEFLYPLAQAYDSVSMDVDLEIGGNDQMFNMMCGRDLMKSLGMRDKFVMTLKILADEQGKKMGKSEGNAVFLSNTPEEMYGIIMSWSDGFIAPAFELATKKTMAEVKEIKKKLGEGVNPRDMKMKLAFEIVSIVHGEKRAREAEEYFVRIVQKKEIPEEIAEKKLKIKNWKLVDLLAETELTSSKGEARRMIQQNAVRVNGKVVADAEMEIEITKEGVLLQKGKRGFVRVVLK
ncbi:tyrosine--tRNA ligase [Candidatus Falkowbacteria bacterium RIFOXYB2_FULL_34_18]|uniref:Tyrosine--tRNA ligase n=1 Tax=Candidatus Falkowbacteria bacterium RIFOXYD2_FULL_34_120 TaxID=1798007 RepID=A0A1F5TPE1_9BACT|nr:MAG: tyrosine--tRNA ligase [Candidatus Falkowbacteria bacterium RIFOXYB2_FULL_34_18]OGF29037.1 MAG: tyrosine--tRNA ligase [Candidatus Falkowbacteria bacterium RIFOXYC12_FULL_34_55]OGF36070.1 MAG: tyrosine--tRNA ligase [Candidatus Falkowbacteria bacterium RIFOXYC2_FULL_34_220]OGF38548.1 MAG: tyrosine--tRNA ligase [Candidatus Falkowbacteria bacterium RIFOXYD12_FULL_34_57]OGF40707.1 MAG: tyrosine--tRNA ligase [Candidatus Falkowbacteria bacterium RIFOXYD2_FULL_34_120]